MKQNSSKGEKFRKTVYYAGAGLAIGAGVGMILGPLLFENLAQGFAIGIGVGMIWGPLLFENLALGCVIGAAVGLVIGAAIDAQRRHKTDSDE